MSGMTKTPPGPDKNIQRCCELGSEPLTNKQLFSRRAAEGERSEPRVRLSSGPHPPSPQPRPRPASPCQPWPRIRPEPRGPSRCNSSDPGTRPCSHYLQCLSHSGPGSGGGAESLAPLELGLGQEEEGEQEQRRQPRLHCDTDWRAGEWRLYTRLRNPGSERERRWEEGSGRDCGGRRGLVVAAAARETWETT